MQSRSKSNNFIAILIALLLFAIGFVLYAIHEQSKSGENSSQRQTSVLSTTKAISPPEACLQAAYSFVDDVRSA